MTLLQRYMFKGAMTAFLATLGGLTSVVWVTQALREVDLLTSKGQSFFVFLFVTSLTIPSLVMFIGPIALFIAVVYTLTKLNGDSELIVMSAAGSPPGLLLRPFLMLTLVVACLTASMSIIAMPWSFRVLRDMLTQVRADFITRVVRPGQFTTLDQGFVFHYRERGAGGELLGVFMQDRREADKTVTYVAEVGRTEEKDDQNYLVLEHGNVQRQTPGERDASLIEFKRDGIDLAQFEPEDEGAPLKPRERTTLELVRRDRHDPYVERFEGRFRAELYDRFTSPLYTFVACIVAFVALGEPRTTRQGRGTAIGIAVLAFGLLRVAGIASLTLILRSPSAVMLAFAVPLVSVAVGSAMIFGLPSLPFSLRLAGWRRRAEGFS